MVQRIAGDRQAPALDGVGEHHARAISHGVAGPVAASSRPRSWPPRFCTSGGSSSSGTSSRKIRAVSSPGQEALAQLGAGVGEQRLVLLVGHLVDVAPQGVAARRANADVSSAPVLRLDDVPAGAVEELHQLLDLLVGDTRSRLWRLVSTTHITEPRPCSAGSVMASHTLPSSSSASPARAMNGAGSWAASGVGERAPARERAAACVAGTRCASGAAGRRGEQGATTPRPTEPVEKSATSGSFVRLG